MKRRVESETIVAGVGSTVYADLYILHMSCSISVCCASIMACP